MKQLSFLKPGRAAYGGELLKKRKGRERGRPLSTRTTMHLVLRSTRARDEWSFRRPEHARRIRALCDRFAKRYGVRVLSAANVANHLHFQVKLSNRHLYRPFIRALTGAIAMAVTGAGRGRPLAGRFWDYRPFSRIIQSLRAHLNLRDYIQINELEGQGYARPHARWLVHGWKGS